MAKKLNEQELIELAIEIQNRIDTNINYEEKLALFQSHMTMEDMEDFFHSDESAETIVKLGLNYYKTDKIKPGDLNREELIELVNKIMRAECEEWEHNLMISQIKKAVLDPNISDYIYWSDVELTAEEVVDKALSYKPIAL